MHSDPKRPEPGNRPKNPGPADDSTGLQLQIRPGILLATLGAALLVFLLLTGLNRHATEKAEVFKTAGVGDSKNAQIVAPTNPSPTEIEPMVDERATVTSFAPESPLSIPEHWGIKITKVRVVAGGKALDVRYKVVDVNKATSLLHLTNYVYIYNQLNQSALMVPFQRENQTVQKLVAGKVYFTLLPNKEERVKPGSFVTFVLGGSRAENLVVD